MKPVDYIYNSRTFDGWEKTVRIALSKCKTKDEFSEIVHACYDRHMFWVDVRGIKYDMGPSRYANLLERIDKMTRAWYITNFPDERITPFIGFGIY
tara:strand:+ start:11399 stop:11686 length:288 start_codon:yes stop_codon:yes gene_type:complete